MPCSGVSKDVGADDRFRPVMAEADLVEGQAVSLSLDGRPMAICRSGGRLYAFDNLCPHAGAPLGSGRIMGGVVSCPLHGARFDLASGECLTRRMGLADVAVHAVRVVEGRIEVAPSDQPVSQPQT